MKEGAQMKNITGTQFDIIIEDSWSGTVAGTNYGWKVDGFKIKWSGDDDVYSPLKGSSCKINFIVEDASAESDLTDIFNNVDTKHYLNIIKAESQLLWSGFPTTKFPAIKNEGYPKRITIEAVDRITLIKEQGVWDATNTVSWVYHNKNITHEVDRGLLKYTIREADPNYGKVFTGQDTAFRFGQVNNGALPHKVEPTIVEILWSALFDLDVDSSLTQRLILAEHWGFGQTNSPRLTGGLANTKIYIDQYVYDDYPKNTERSGRTMGEILSHVCEIFAGRFMQWNGHYYFIQNEIYQHSNTVNVFEYRYGPGFTQLPIDYSQTTWSASDYKETINTTSLPRWEEGSTYGYTQPLRKIEMASLDAGGIATQDYPRNRSISSPNTPTNFTAYSQPIKKIPSKGSRFNLTGLSVNKGRNWRQSVWRQEASGSTRLEWMHDHCVRAHFEASYEPCQTIKGKILDDDTYTPIQAITYDSKDWIWSSISYSAEMDEWDGQFIEMNASEPISGRPEIINQDG